MVKFKIEGKEYKKNKPTVKDWRDYLGYKDEMDTKNFLTDADTYDKVTAILGEYVGAPTDADYSDCDLLEVMTAYQEMRYDIYTVFTKAQEVWDRAGLKNVAAAESDAN